MADEGVEFLLELNAKLDETTKMVREMTRVQAEAAKLDQALRKAGKATSFLNDLTGKAGAAFKSAGTAMLGHLAALASFEGLSRLGSAIMNVGSQALVAAGEAERTRRSFELLLGDAPAAELLGFLDRLAAKTEFTDGQLKGFAGSLLRAGFAGEDLVRAMAGVVDLAAMPGDKMANAAEAIGLLSKIRLKGGISERELVSAGMNPAKVFERVAAETGIAVANVEKQIGAGKVRAGTLIEALYSEIAAKTGKDLGGAGVAMSMTFLSQLEKAKDIIPNLFEEIEASGDLMRVTEALNKVTEALSPDSPAGRKIVGGLVGMLNRFADLTTKVDFDAWSNRLVTAMELFTTLVEVGAEVGRELGMLFDNFTRFGESLGEVLFETTEMVGEFFSAAAELGGAVWRGLVDGITARVTEVVDSVKFLGKEAIGALKGVLGISSPSKVFANLGLMTAQGFELGIHRALPGVADTVAGAFAPASLLPAVGAGGAEGAAAAAPRFACYVTVNVGAAPGDEARARQVADDVGVSVRKALEAAFEAWAAEGAAT